VKVYFAKDTPKGSILLKNARNRDHGKGNGGYRKENIAGFEHNADQAVWKDGNTDWGDAKVVDATGKNDYTGFIDTHAHTCGLLGDCIRIQFCDLRRQIFAYGVTTT